MLTKQWIDDVYVIEGESYGHPVHIEAESPEAAHAALEKLEAFFDRNKAMPK